MSIARSEQNYKLAKTIFQDVKDDFYSIENSTHPDEGYMLDQTLEDIKKLNRYLGRIDTEILLDKYDFDLIDTIEKNIDVMKEGTYFIEKSLMGMKLFDEVKPVIGPYIKEVDWNSIADSQEDAELKFVNFLTSRDNYDKYKTIVNNIVKGTMKKKAFADLFNSVKSRMLKPKSNKTEYVTPNPPSMYDKKGKSAWEKEKERAKKEALKHSEPEGAEEFDVMGESFISFSRYKKLFESMAYYCNTCGERAEHEEIEEDPNKRCPNCGDSNWSDENEYEANQEYR